MNNRKCPKCGQGTHPIGKHGKCSYCGEQVDFVVYDKENKRGPAWNMSTEDEYHEGDEA